MRVLRRLCAVVYVLASVFALGGLALTWFGPWTAEASALLGLREYCAALLACLAVSAVGLVVVLAAAFSGRKVRTVEVASVDGGSISVTRAAIAAQASHIVEEDGTCTAARVRVDAKPRGHVRVHVRVLPHETLDVVAKGAELHEELRYGLATVCGDTVDSVSLEFVEPASAAPAPDAELAAEEGARAEAPAAPAGDPRPQSGEAAGSTSEITVSMGQGPRDAGREA